MICVKGAARTTSLAFHAPSSFRRSSVNLRSPFSVRMSSSADHKQIIEHIVLFKAKPDADVSAVNAMLTNLNSLVSLDSVLHLSAGPVSRCRSKTLNFTHMLHSRYLSKENLDSYTVNPTHVSVVANYVKPVVDDVMAVDWVADDFSGSAVVSPGSALRLTILKVKEGLGQSGKGEVLGVLKEVKDKFPSIEQLTVGENFSPARAKGFSICSIAGFRGLKELEALDSESEVVNEQKEKAREFLDGVLVLDYLVGASVQSPAAASL